MPTQSSTAFCELSSDDKRIEVFFKYNAAQKDALKHSCPGARFHAEGPHGPHWSVPARIENARALRQIFGEGMELGEAVRRWGHVNVKSQARRTALTNADDHPIESLRIAKTHPELAAYLRPYQRADVALMSETNVLNANQPGCMASETMVEVNRNGKSYKLTIEDLCRRFNGDDRYAYDHKTPTRIRCRTSDGYIRLVELKAVYDSGKKQTYRVTTDSGRSVRATADHPFLTPHGWSKLSELTTDDEVYVDAGRPCRGTSQTVKVQDIEVHLAHHPYARKAVKVVAMHRLVYEAQMNDMTYDQFVTAVRGAPTYSQKGHDVSSLKFLSPTTIVHHIDGDHTNNALDNLETFDTHADHARHHSNWQNVTAITRTERVVSVEKSSVEHTYDIELVGAPHNFLANGFVVHNTGKTIEVLAALCETGIDQGAHLIIAPIVSLENVWRVEIERWIPNAKVYTSEDATERKAEVIEAIKQIEQGTPAVYVLTNVEWIRPYKLKKDENPEDFDLLKINDYHQGRYTYRDDIHRAILSVKWDSYTVDEFHRTGLNSRDTVTTWGSSIIDAKRRYLLSGTPMGGIPDHLFAPLRDIEPTKFSSYWRWASQWLVVTEEGYNGAKEVGGIKPGQEDRFYEAHAAHMVRRLKREALPGLPPKVRQVIKCEMTKRQAAQYSKFERDAEVMFDNGDMVSSDSVLAEYARLKQFANAYCTFDTKGRVVPTADSGKLVQLVEKLNEFGIHKSTKQNPAEPGARAIVASQSARMVEMVTEYLTAQGIACDALTGDTKDRKSIIDRFTTGSDEPYVIVMTTATGGVSLNLERASSIHILDESWNPDDEEQLEDRGDRGSRTSPLFCYYYRTANSIQDQIAAVAKGKAVTNKNVLDLYRQMRKARKA
jgi:hypothetical protein